MVLCDFYIDPITSSAATEKYFWLGDNLECGDTMLQAQPFTCWGRGLRKPPLSEVPHYNLSNFSFNTELPQPPLRRTGRGRGVSFARSMEKELLIGGWQCTSESESVSKDNKDQIKKLQNQERTCRSEGYCVDNRSNLGESQTISGENLINCRNLNKDEEDNSAPERGNCNAQTTVVSATEELPNVFMNIHSSINDAPRQRYKKSNSNNKHKRKDCSESSASASSGKENSSNSHSNIKSSRSKSKIYRQKEMDSFGICNATCFVSDSDTSDSSGSVSSSAETSSVAINQWFAKNFAESVGAPQKRTLVDDEFPSLPSCAEKSNESKSSNIRQKKGSQLLNLKSVANSLFDPISRSGDGNSSENSSVVDEEVPHFLSHLVVKDNSTKQTLLPMKTVTFTMINIPGDTEYNNLKQLLQPYGMIIDLQISPAPSGDTVVARVEMKTRSDSKWIEESLHDAPLFGASAPNIKLMMH